MSWQWIPAEITPVVGANALNSYTYNYEQFRPGYFIGKDKDKDLYLVALDTYYPNYNEAYSVISSMNNWIMVSDPNLCFKVSAYTSADVFKGETTVAQGGIGAGSQPYVNQDNQHTYFGKPSYNGGGLILQYSVSEGAYIIYDSAYRDINCEPVYSTNQLSGGLSGDHFWKSNVTDLDIYSGVDYGSVEGIRFNLAGAKDRVEAGDWGDDYTKYYIALPYLDYYKYSSPSEISAYDEYPAGEYTNPRTGETKTVGIKTYKGDDNSIWKGFRLNSTSNWNPPYYESVEHGRITYTKNTTDWGNAWVSPGGNKAPKYVYPNALSALPDSFTLKYFEYDEELSAYSEVLSASIQMAKGPYQILSSDSSILMGEFSQWR